MNRNRLIIVIVVSLIAAFLGTMLLYHTQRENQAAQSPDVRKALVRMHSPMLGRPDAPVVIVEFFDPACESCKAFYPLVKDIMAQHPDQIALVLRYAPFHNGSDKVVAVLEAARKQDKFWPVLEALLASQAEWAPHHRAQIELVWKPLEGLGLNLDKLRADMAAPAVAAVLAQDIEDARVLKVAKTPEFFVNGQPLLEFGHEPLKKLVSDELKKAERK